ncbi:hypothetical protein glysoja_049015 [Glycine soja]|uniref:Secreted protein n=1 Tax=Glycine soja TaxID=3848 RepID=A0A0B2QZP9_GLYSO|nr:hypothetical protein glysoja_049015 [Glycine soja]
MRANLTTLTQIWMTLLLSNILPMPISPCGSISWDGDHKAPSGPGVPGQDFTRAAAKRRGSHPRDTQWTRKSPTGPGVSSSGYGPLSVLQGARIAPARHPVDSEKSNRVLGFPTLITGLCVGRNTPVAWGWPAAGNRSTTTTSPQLIHKKVRALLMTHDRPIGEQVQSQR